jgi:hypothetical protein
MEKQTLPNATAVLVLGILSIPGCCFYGIGLILGIIALVLASSDKKLYVTNPDLYSNYSNLNLGRILAIIGIAISLVYIILMIFMVVYFGMEAIQNPTLMQERIRELSGQ